MARGKTQQPKRPTYLKLARKRSRQRRIKVTIQSMHGSMMMELHPPVRHPRRRKDQAMAPETVTEEAAAMTAAAAHRLLHRLRGKRAKKLKPTLPK